MTAEVDQFVLGGGPWREGMASLMFQGAGKGSRRQLQSPLLLIRDRHQLSDRGWWPTANAMGSVPGLIRVSGGPVCVTPALSVPLIRVVA